MNKKVLSIVAAATLCLTTAFAVWAECGEAKCDWVGDKMYCVVETPGGGKTVCTVDNPCDIKCP